MILKHSIKIKDSLTRSLFIFISVVLLYSIPSLSHIVGFPLYLFEPMKLVVIISIILLDRKTAMVYAATIPLFSFLLTGHPVFPKFIIISAELTLFTSTYFYLYRRFSSSVIAISASILLSKIFYYLIKYFFISSGVLSIDLISTPFYIQLSTFVIHGGLFMCLLTVRKK